MASLADHDLPIRVIRILTPPGVGAGWVLAELLSGDNAVRWGASDPASQVTDAGWGQARPLIRGGGLRSLSLQTEPLTAQQLRPQPLDQGDREITIRHELDGKLQEFGKRFWTLIAERHRPHGPSLPTVEAG